MSLKSYSVHNKTHCRGNSNSFDPLCMDTVDCYVRKLLPNIDFNNNVKSYANEYKQMVKYTSALNVQLAHLCNDSL